MQNEKSECDILKEKAILLYEETVNFKNKSEIEKYKKLFAQVKTDIPTAELVQISPDKCLIDICGHKFHLNYDFRSIKNFKNYILEPKRFQDISEHHLSEIYSVRNLTDFGKYLKYIEENSIKNSDTKPKFPSNEYREEDGLFTLFIKWLKK